MLLITPCVLHCISGLVSRSIAALITRDTYQVMMIVQNIQTFVPPTRQPVRQEQVVERVSNADTYVEDDYVHTYELEPEENVESA